MELKKYLFFLILSLILVGCANNKIKDKDKIVAMIGEDYKVTLGDLKQYIADWNYDRRFGGGAKTYNFALNKLIFNQLKRFDFFDRKLNENQDLMKKIRPFINNELIRKYFDKEFMQKYVNEKKAAEAYKEMDKEVICNDVFLPFSEKPSKNQLDSLKTLASEIEKGISNNEEIDAVINVYSSRNSIMSNVKYITWTQSMNDPVAYIAFKLKVGSTQVIQAYNGFHVIKIIGLKKIKPEPFDKVKDKILSDLKMGYYQEYNNQYDNFRDKLIDKKSVKWNKAGLDQLIKWSKNDDHFYTEAYKDTMQNAIQKGDNFEILSYNNGKVNLKEFLRLLEEVVALSPTLVLSANNVKDFILDAVYDDNVVKAAQNMGIEAEFVNPYTDVKIIKGRLAYLYNQAVIEGSIPEATPEALKKFYQDQKDSIFYQLKKINIYTRIYSDSVKAASEIKEINKGTPFEKVSNRWFVKTFIRERDGSLKSFGSKELPYLAEAAFKLGLNEVAGPVEYLDAEKGKQFAVIKCIRIRPEKQLTYDDVKGKRIVEEFNNYYRQKISDEVEVKLKKKYGVKIFEDVLSEAIAAK
ncbi:MAG: peptidylprolyl isomerase [Ignavibacteria bacterium]|jgi:hypothetical protein